MRDTSPVVPPASYSPMPDPLHRRYLWLLHVLAMGLPVLALSGALWDPRTDWGWRQAALVGLVSLQVALYLKTFVLPHPWPLPWWWLAGYYLGSLGLWLIEGHLDRHFFLLFGMYLGQMYFFVPPRLAIPVTLVVLGLFFGLISGWDVSRLPREMVVNISILWTILAVVFSYARHMGQTSRERAGLIAELQAAQHDLEVARQRDAELAALRERERLARDLHDSLGHALVALSVQLEAVQRLYTVDPARASAQVDAMKDLTRASMAELRRALEGLRTPGLGDRSLQQALDTLSREVSARAGMEVRCQVAAGVDALEPAVSEALWRMAQEALTNVEKHANAHHVQVCVEMAPHVVTMRISDDGWGLPPDAASRSGHYGLRGMRERLEGLGGTLTLHSNGQRGTLVEACLPIIAASRQS
jgi:signal transduction histidine kinase